MPVPFDLHLHSSFSSDSETPMEKMVQRAIDLKLSTVCFTEHLDYDYPPNPEGLTFLPDLPAYEAEVHRLQERYGSRLEILFGIEMGMQSHLAARYAQLIHSHDFDYLIASQHLTDGLDPYERDFWTGRSEAEVYRQYFTELYANLQSMTQKAGSPSPGCDARTGKAGSPVPDFDTAAHLDYIVRYGPDQNRFYSYARYADVIDPILRFLIRSDKCLEVNTAGLKYGLGQTNPASDVLKRYRELGGSLITLGSDAHEPAHMAWEFDAAARMLLSLGFESACIFRQRKLSEVSLKEFCLPA